MQEEEEEERAPPGTVTADVAHEEKEEELYMTMLTSDLLGEARAAEAALLEAKSEAAAAAAALDLAEAGVVAAESRLKAGVAAAEEEAKVAADALFAAEAKVALAESRLDKLESRMRDISERLAAAEAAAEAAEAAADKRRQEAEEEEEKAEEKKRRAEEVFDAAVAAAAAEATAAAKANFVDANFPVDAEGHVYHLGIRRGEIANRIVSVGDHQRAALIASFLDPLPETGEVFQRSSKRGFTVYTGVFAGVRVSVVATGMGMAMMDFVVRECRAVVDGQMAICRLGTCGLLDASLPVGTVVVASPGSVSVRREPDAFSKPVKGATPLPPYRISNLVESDPELSRLLMQRLSANLVEEPEVLDDAEDEEKEEEVEEGEEGRGVDAAVKEAGGGGRRPKVVMGLNCTADSFYSSQGRTGDDFDDRNDDLIDAILAGQTSATSLEMETFHLLDLARCSRNVNGLPGVVAAAAAIGLAQRKSNEFIESNRIERLERVGGISLLEALAARTLQGVDNVSPGDVDAAHRAAAGLQSDSDAPEEGARADGRGADNRVAAAGATGIEEGASALASASDESGSKADGGGGGAKGAGGGGPVAWFKAYAAKSREMAATVKALGLAGVTAYGVCNTLYYTLAFAAAWTFQAVPTGLGLLGTARAAAKVMSVVWAGSQVTKLLRFALAIAAAPKVDAFMRWASEKSGRSYEKMFAGVTVGCLLAFVVTFSLMIATKAAA